jgi:hypothetical protein
MTLAAAHEDQNLLLRKDLWLYPERGLKVERYRKGRARPDGTLAPAGIFVDAGEWADPDPVLMTVEINRRLVLYSEPLSGVYSSIRRWPFGHDVELPEPVGITLNTEQLAELVD